MRHLLEAIARGEINLRAARLACGMVLEIDESSIIADPRARRRARKELRDAGLLQLIELSKQDSRLNTLSSELARAVATEAAARVARGTVRNEAAYLRALIERSQTGQFRPTVKLES